MASKSTKKSTKRQSLFNPLKRPMPYIGLLLALLIILFQGTIRKYTADYVGNWLISNLKDSTKGNYSIDYDFVRFDIFTKELRIRNFNLALDTAVTDQETYLQQYTNLVDISTPLVVLKLESLWEIILNDKILIAFVGMQEPNIKLVRSKDLTKEENQENKQETAEKIRRYLEELEIDSFRVLNGALQVDLQNEQQQDVVAFSIRNFSTLLRGFKLDEINPEKLFQGIFVEELELELIGQEIILPGLNHKLMFDRLSISSPDSIIKLDTLKISPLASADSSFSSNLMINEIAFTGIDFKKAYEESKIDIKKLEINNPNLSLIKKSLSTATNMNINLGQLPFEEVSLDKIHLNNGKVSLDINRKLTSEDVYIKIMNYRIDSSTIFLEDLTKGLQNFNFNATNTTIELPDSIHELKIGNLAVNAADSVALINNIQINPIASRTYYNLYKQQGVGLINYSTIKEILLSGVDFNQALNHHQLMIDSVHIYSPTTNITEYPYIKSKQKEKEKLAFLIGKATVTNGMVNYNKRQNGQNNRSQAQGISLFINQLYPVEGKSIAFDNLSFTISDGFSEIKPIAHTLHFVDLQSNNINSLNIAELSLAPDSASIDGEKIYINSSDLRIRGFNHQQFKAGSLKLNELSAETLSLQANLVSRRNNNKNLNQIKKAIIDKIYLKKGDFKIIDKENDVSVAGVSTLIDSLYYDATSSGSNDRAFPVGFKNLLFSHGNFSVSSKIDKTTISGKAGRFSETDSLINFEDITFNATDKVKGRLKQVYLKGFDRKAFLESKGLVFQYLYLDQPKLEIEQAIESQSNSKFRFNNDSIRNALLEQFSIIKFDSIINRNGNITLSSDDRISRLDNLNLIIRDYTCDSTTSSNDVLQPTDALLKIDSITSNSAIDTVIVKEISLDMINNTLSTGSIDVSVHQKKEVINAQIPGLVAKGFSSTKLLNSDFSLDTIRLSQANITINTNDSINSSLDIESTSKDLGSSIKSLFKKSEGLYYDTIYRSKAPIVIDKIELDSSKNINFKDILSKLKLAGNRREEEEKEKSNIVVHEDSLITVTLSKKAISTSGTIKHIGLNNSKFNWLVNDKPHEYLSNINFSIEINNLILDTLNEFNIYNHIHGLTLGIKDYKLNFPDSLNTLSFDKLNLSTEEESIAIQNVTLTPRVDKYDYANRVGYQKGWHHLQNLDINIEKLDMFKLLADKTLYVQKIGINNGTLDIFKDKELPIPVNQRKPMLQDAIRNIKIPVHIDSISLDNFRVNFSSRLSSRMPEGSLEMYEMQAWVTNVVNIDSVINKNPNLIIRASTKMMNKGLLSANFNFDMGDNNNPFKFDAHLSSMSATEFNSLLEALAFVSVESGKIKDLSLEAEGDMLYATGNMKFRYNDLKVSTINKKNLKTKGMGKVMKTFFANAFVVKKNNPAFKLFPREGAMYYERDPQKIIIDYVTKTALSGVVSSIGARNARKDIKKIQKESKKQKDTERKAARKADRKTSP